MKRPARRITIKLTQTPVPKRMGAGGLVVGSNALPSIPVPANHPLRKSGVKRIQYG